MTFPYFNLTFNDNQNILECNFLKKSTSKFFIRLTNLQKKIYLVIKKIIFISLFRNIVKKNIIFSDFSMNFSDIFMEIISPDKLFDEVVDTFDETDKSARVILFNDEWHTFDEVIEQIIKATACSYNKAEALTFEVHNSGKSAVFEGDFSDCLRVSSVLEEISLHTQIEY